MITRYVLGSSIALFILIAPWVYFESVDAHLRNFHVVEEGVLYRSGQLTTAGLKEIVRNYRIKSVITLRSADEEGQPHPDAEEEQFCYSQEVKHYRIPHKQFWAPGGEPIPADENAKKFLAILQDPENLPALVHCMAGKHRTGAYCAIYRMTLNSWDAKQAIDEMKAHGYHNIEDHQDLLGYLTNFPNSKICESCDRTQNNSHPTKHNGSGH